MNNKKTEPKKKCECKHDNIFVDNEAYTDFDPASIFVENNICNQCGYRLDSESKTKIMYSTGLLDKSAL